MSRSLSGQAGRIDLGQPAVDLVEAGAQDLVPLHQGLQRALGGRVRQAPGHQPAHRDIQTLRADFAGAPRAAPATGVHGNALAPPLSRGARRSSNPPMLMA